MRQCKWRTWTVSVDLQWLVREQSDLSILDEVKDPFTHSI